MKFDDPKFDDARYHFEVERCAQTQHQMYLEQFSKKYGGSMIRDTLIAGGMFDHWPGWAKDKVRVAIRKANDAREAGFNARPKHVHMTTMAKLRKQILES